MSSRTPNIDLVLPVGGEHVSRAIINENNTKIDTFAGSASSSLSTLSEQIGKFKSNNWAPTSSTTLLSYINANVDKANGFTPVTFAKTGNVGVTDIPFTNTAEFVCTVFGYERRLLVEIRQYENAKRSLFQRTYWNGSWQSEWTELAPKDNIVNDEDSTKTALSQYTGNGIWYLNVGNMSDKPSGASGWGYLLSMYKSNQNYHMLFSPTTETIYIRRYYGSGWGTWQRLAAANQKTHDYDGTTDATGNVIVTGTLPFSFSNIVKVVPNRSEGFYTGFYEAVIAQGADGSIVIHCFKPDGTALASQSVRIRVYYQ